MRGIDRVLAVILLLGSVGGAAAFARHSGSDSTAPIVGLAAPPQQHVTDPGTVLIAPTPAPRVAPTHRVTRPQATLQRPVQAVQPQRQVQPAERKPALAPVETAPPPVQAPQAPVQTPEPPRALAVVQPAQPQAPEAPTADIPLVLPPNDSTGDEQGNSNDQQGNDNGDEHGQGSGHDQNGGSKHSGD